MSENKEPKTYKEIRFDDIINLIAERLSAGGSITFTPNGNSMEPMLRDGEDTVVISAKPEGKLKLFDVPLYRRKDGSYVLHRVIDFGIDGSYVMCGDNQFQREYGITDDEVIGVLTAFYRNGKGYTPSSLRYRLYLHFWFKTRVFRKLYNSAAFRIKKKLEKNKEDTENNDSNETNENSSQEN